MNRTGYTLAVLPTPVHMPAWAADLTSATQAVMDGQYLHGPGGLDNFYDQADSWIQTETLKRAQSPDPKASYVPAPFKMSIPKRQLVSYDEYGNMTSYFADADPSIAMPALPAWKEPTTAPDPLFGGTHPPVDPTQLLAAVMAQLMLIGTRITSLDQRLAALQAALKG